MSEGARSEPTLAELLNALAKDTGTLVRQEIQLASAEMAVKARRVSQNLGYIAIGGALGVIGLLALVTAAIAALAAAVPIWLSAVIVGIVISITGYAFVRKGKAGLGQIGALPDQTVATLNADVAWAKEQIR